MPNPRHREKNGVCAICDCATTRYKYCDLHAEGKHLHAKLKLLCEKCGRVKNLLLHHIDGNWRHNEPENLMVLCKSCHRKKPHPNSIPRPYMVQPTTRSLARFEEKYATLGGLNQLKDMLGKNQPLQSIGDHFGVTREQVRQWRQIYALKGGKRKRAGKPLVGVYVRLSEEVQATIKQMALQEKQHTSPSDLYRIAVKEFIERRLSGTPQPPQGPPMGALTYRTQEE